MSPTITWLLTSPIDPPKNHCRKTESNNPFRDLIPTDAWEDLVNWFFESEVENLPYHLGKPGILETTLDGVFHLIQQRGIKCHDIKWIPLQVQTQQVTLFTVYVQADAYRRGDIRNWPIAATIRRGAHVGIPEQTVFADEGGHGCVRMLEAHPEDVDVGLIRKYNKENKSGQDQQNAESWRGITSGKAQ